MILNGWRLDGAWWTAPDGRRLRAIRGGGSSGKTTTTVVNQIPAKTPEEIALLAKQNEILDIQIGELKRQNAALEAIFPQQKQLLGAQTQAAIAAAEFQKIQTEQLKELAPQALQIQKQQAELQTQLMMKALADLEGTPAEQEIKRLSDQRALALLRGEAPPLLPGQQERITLVFGRAAEEAQAGLRTFGEELATSRGMRVTDTPIGGELLRQGRELASSLAAAKAGAELNVGQTEQQFGEAVRQFQENLRQRAFQNRLALTGNVMGAGGGGAATMTPVFATTTPQATMAGAQGLLNTLTQERLAGASQRTTSRMEQFPGVLDYVKAAASIAGAVAGAVSSARLKTAIVPYDPDEYDRALAKLRETPIATWKYRWDSAERHARTGPLLELAPPEIREDALRIDLLSYAGLLHAGLKSVDRKVERFEARLAAALAEAA